MLRSKYSLSSGFGWKTLCCIALVGLTSDGSVARADFSIQASSAGSALAGASYANFDNFTLGTGTGGNLGTSGSLSVQGMNNASTAGQVAPAVVQGNAAGQYGAPNLGVGNNTFFGSPYTGGDTTNYLSTGNGAITLSFGGPTNYLGLLWGSVDAFNSLTFYSGTQVVGTITGTMVNAMAGSSKTSDSLYVNITSGSSFTSVVASSTSSSFEFDNVAYGNFVVPEPSSLALCGIAGLVGMGVARARRRRSIA